MGGDPIGRPMEILLIEDSWTDAGLTMDALRDAHVKHRMMLAREGEEAMEFLRQEGRFNRAPTPDLILLDLRLPRKDGREVLEEIKSDSNLGNIPIVIMTASQTHEDMVRSEELQVDAYVTKPVDLDKSVAIIRKLKHFWHKGILLPVEI